MCGLAGILSERPVSTELLSRMAGSLVHRGPDDGGTWSDSAAGIGFAHRRLSIVDLSPLGHQPMAASDGRLVIAFNGEIYNHMAMRAQLEESRSVPWRGRSDTETLIECISAWGLKRTLQQAVGMFALALWDRHERKLHLARDRFGEKPLYYGWVGRDFVFGSELKALRQHPRFDNQVDRRALRLLTARAYVPAPLSIYEGIFKLEPGVILTAGHQAWRSPATDPPTDGSPSTDLRMERYWSYREAVRDGLSDPFQHEGEALDALEQALAAAIKGQAVADVPVGAFLSGGIDSSTVVGLYQKYWPGRVKTFTIGFEEAGFNEAEYAKEVARHFGTEHHERYVSFKEAQDVIPNLPRMYDEPFGDSSQVPTHLVSKLAREHVTVALSGDGGDELFAGYNRYFGTVRMWEKLNRLPTPLRRAGGQGLALVPPAAWNAAVRLLPSRRRPSSFGSRVQKTFRTIGTARQLGDFVDSFLDDWAGSASPVLPLGEHPSECAFDLDLGEGAPDVARMMYCDATSYLPDDILCKVDRAAMAVSLETRVPFLDHRVAEVAARIPLSMKIKGPTGKAILRQLLYRHAPSKLFERPKAGFAMPIGEWLRGPLRPWAEALLNPARISQDGFFDPARIERAWKQHLEGGVDRTQALWTVLMFQAWHAEQSSGEAESILGGPQPRLAASA